MKNIKIYRIVLIIAVIAVGFCAMASGGCTEEKHSGEYVKADMTYYIESMNLWGRDLTGFFEKEETYVKLTKGGDLEVKVVPTKTAYFMVNLAIGAMAIGGEKAIDVSFADTYLTGLFPTESIKDMQKALERIKTDLGLSIEGIDYENEKVKKLFASLAENGTVPSGISVPETLSLSIKGRYELKTIKSATREEPFRAVYLGENGYPENGEPYIIMTQFVNDKALECIRITNEVVALDIVASVPQPELVPQE